jgi:hypothetical protein
MELKDDYILNLEFVHDNKNDINEITPNDILFDLINRKIINIDHTIKNPEDYMKELIFNDINYNDILINNKKLENRKIEFNDNITIVFDNMLLYKSEIEQMDRLFNNKIKKIFIPFVFICEQLLNDRFASIIECINYYKKIDERIYIDEFYENGKLKEIYKIEADNIGLAYNDNKDRLINYKVFSNTEDFDKNKITYELTKLKFYIEKNEIESPEIKKILKEIYEIINNIFRYSDEDTKNEELIKENLNKIKFFVMSLKESRDSYYINEIKNMQLKYNDENYIYIVSDEISNIRCLLNKISNINVATTQNNGIIPRYIINIKNDEIILKLFNMYHKFNSNIYEKIKKYENENGNMIFEYSYPIIEKIIIPKIGGLINNKINENDIKTLKLINNKPNNDIYLYIMENIKYKVIEIIPQIQKIHNLFKINKFKTIEEISKNNKEYIILKNELYDIMLWLLELSNYEWNDLYKYIKYNDQPILLQNLDSTFMGRIYVIYDRKIKEYNNYYNEDISKYLRGLYVGWMFEYMLMSNDIERIEMYEYIYQDFFRKYNIRKLYNLFNIYRIINEKEKKNSYHDE